MYKKRRKHKNETTGGKNILLPQYVRYSAVCKNVSETKTLKIQFIPDEHAFPVLLAQRGYISEFTVQGIGPIPEKNIKLKISVKQFIRNLKKGSLSPLKRDTLINTTQSLCLPGAKKTRYKIRPRSAVQEYGVGQKL